MFFLPNKKDRAFTLIELIVVIGIIAVLAAIVILAINPVRQFAQARNSRRQSDVRALALAVTQYAAQRRTVRLHDGLQVC